MGNSSSAPPLSAGGHRVTALQEETGFSPQEITRLYSRFKDLDTQDKGWLTRKDFLCITGLSLNPLGDRIIHAFFRGSKKRTEEEHVDFHDFLMVMSHFRPVEQGLNSRNTRREKLKFAFSMYDLDGDGFISSKELEGVLRKMVGDKFTDEELDSYVKRAFLEVDFDQDDVISFDEFIRVMETGDGDQDVEVGRKLSTVF